MLQLVQNVPIKKDIETEISIGIFGGANSYNLTLRLVLQIYGFFVRILENSQETLFAIEDNLILMLIISPESENDEAFCLCKAIREKYALLEFPVLLLVDKYSSCRVEKNFEGQINDFLVRPVDISAVLARIQILENHRKLWLEKQELLKSEKEKSAFLYFVTHNVNTPLTVLLNEIKKMQENAKISSDENLLSEIQNIHDCAGQINIIIQNVLNSYRISDGRYLVNQKIINLKDFFIEKNKFLIQKSKRKNQNFEFECSLQNPCVFCDENSLKGVYANLVDNAIKYTLDEGNIKVKIKENDENIFLRVKRMLEKYLLIGFSKNTIETRYKNGIFELDLDELAVFKNGKKIPMRKKQFDMMLYFIRNANKILPFESIYQNVWNEPIPDVFMNLRFLRSVSDKILSKSESEETFA